MSNNTVTTTAAADLQHVIHAWPLLRALLDTSGPDTWPPQRAGAEYLRALDRQDAADAAAGALHPQTLTTGRHENGSIAYWCAFCEHHGGGAHTHPVRPDRDPDQLGERPAPIRLHVHDTMRTIDIGLSRCAGDIAAVSQRPPSMVLVPPVPGWSAAEVRHQGEMMAARDAADPSRWRGGIRPAPDAAAWLLARVYEHPGPFRPLDDDQLLRVARHAQDARQRIDRMTGSAVRSALMDGRPCPWCAGDLWMHVTPTETSVTCAAVPGTCAAPVGYDADRHARVWSTPAELAALERALSAAEAARREERDRVRTAEARRLVRAAERERRARA
ncbi:hypothetical protein [Streptomyces sp. CAU 1734]|uniref:hypothetical protein n=1 Tax=Streptomyces sp. CAU 1734 TaxID=3140360 RepID=UPI003261391B